MASFTNGRKEKAPEHIFTDQETQEKRTLINRNYKIHKKCQDAYNDSINSSLSFKLVEEDDTPYYMASKNPDFDNDACDKYARALKELEWSTFEMRWSKWLRECTWSILLKSRGRTVQVFLQSMSIFSIECSTLNYKCKLLCDLLYIFIVILYLK